MSYLNAVACTKLIEERQCASTSTLDQTLNFSRMPECIGVAGIHPAGNIVGAHLTLNNSSALGNPGFNRACADEVIELFKGCHSIRIFGNWKYWKDYDEHDGGGNTISESYDYMKQTLNDAVEIHNSPGVYSVRFGDDLIKVELVRT